MPKIPFEWKEEYDDEIYLKKVAAWLQFARAPRLSPQEMAKIVLDAGWEGSEAIKAMATAAGESDWRPRAMNVDIRHGRADFGIFQLNEIHNPTEEQKYDPLANAKKAFGLYKHRIEQGKDGFTPWVAYKDGLEPFLRGDVSGFSESKLKFWEKAWDASRSAVSEEILQRQLQSVTDDRNIGP